MIKLVAFDLDGTIGNTLPFCIEAFRIAVKPYTKNKLTEKEIIQTFGLNEEGMIKQVIDNNRDLEKALNDFYEVYQNMHTLCPHPVEGIKELIKELKNNSIIVTLITGKGAKSCDITLQQFNMKNYFDRIGTGSPEKNTKSEAMKSLLNSYRLHPGEMVYIGDAVSDVTESQKAGIRCLSAAWISSATTIREVEKHNPGNIFYSVESLRDFLLKNIFTSQGIR